jgi:cob(I)alamin adenosyltransferase
VTELPPTRPPEMPERTHVASVVIVNTGDGKGKTTSAIGTALRAVARNWKVGVVQFMKSEKWRTGEEEVGRKVGIDWWTLGDGFTWDSKDMDETQARAQAAWAAGEQMISSGAHDVVVLDEITYPMAWGWISIPQVIDVISSRPEHVNVIATGRNAPSELIEIADTVTEMTKVRHAFDRGISARRGIEF